MTEKSLIRIIELIIQGSFVSNTDYEYLIQDLLISSERFQVLDKQDFYVSHSEEIITIIKRRSHLLKLVYPELSRTLAQQNISIDLSSDIFPTLWYYWLPLAIHLDQQQQKLGRPLIQGLLGGQGTGKTTLGIVLNILLKYLGKTFLSISLDDLYKTYADRQKLQLHRPDLIWRGPPSTHDVDLGIQVFQQLRDRHPDNPQKIAIPRFDKSLHNGAGDRIEPEISDGADVILFEGWFVGMRPLSIAAFEKFIPPILTESDRDFALACNARLYDYLPLWDYLHSLIVLIPEDYTYSLQWRLEAEHKLIQSGKSGMNDAETTKFVEYFWKALHPNLFLPPMLGKKTSSDHFSADLVVEIMRSHLPTRIYSCR
ncbi:glycerate kinase [Pseudanabaena sp. FACHB-1998]|uniref:glycerate kinase n=1 Tax=Pseudanabaena sp. FACHB-1998 TaxID=2692858 RepID=UPI001680F7A6|nr:glycerate kinase [Pseudanabaena sp. FACHB-1998]MBD2177034.1 glycerate kinase [Pseudanabaena sp. FACHB-1998]